MREIQNLKKEIFGDAVACSLAVLDESGAEVGKLVPIGEWALNDDQLLNTFADWRKKFMRFFFVQFEASRESTKEYLTNFSIKDENRIFFAIYSNDSLVGHIGLSNITDHKAELDNVVRGMSGGHKDLMYLCEKSLLVWAFETLGIKSVYARVMSKNILAITLHQRLGFGLRERSSVRKIVKKSDVFFEKCDVEDATETFFSDLYDVTSTSFGKTL